MNKVFVNFSLAVNVFRWFVTSLCPVITKTAWVIRKDEILKLQPTATSRSFRYKMSLANYYQELGKKHEKPGLFVSSLSWLIRVLPKIGPLKTLKIKEPGPVAEKYFIQSFDSVLVDCTSSMKNLGAGNINLINIDFDTGNPTTPGEYKLADMCYGSLLLNLRKKKFNLLSDSLKLNIIGFYSNLKPTTTTQKSRKEWVKITEALEQLKISPAQKF
jgi:hypothetical protein